MLPETHPGRLFRAVLLGLLIVGAAGCSLGGRVALPTQVLEPSTSTPRPARVTATVTPPPPPAPGDLAETPVPSAAIPANAQMLVRRVINDLAAKLEVREDEIGVSELEEVAWAGGDLSCDALASDETDAETLDGYRITLMVDGVSFVYHTDESELFVLCRDVSQDIPGQQILLDPVVGSLVELASARLAQRLDLPLRRVFLQDVQAYEWPDNSLGCDNSEQEFSDTPTLGYRLVLRVGRQEYIYHTDFLQVVACPAEAERLPGATTTPDALTATPNS